MANLLIGLVARPRLCAPAGLFYYCRVGTRDDRAVW